VSKVGYIPSWSPKDKEAVKPEISDNKDKSFFDDEQKFVLINNSSYSLYRIVFYLRS